MLDRGWRTWSLIFRCIQPLIGWFCKFTTAPSGDSIGASIRSHLRSVTPLPTAELVALKRSVAEVSAVGRNINQIARAFNQGERGNSPGTTDLYAVLRALNGLRVHIKELINANLASWRSGYERTNH